MKNIFFALLLFPSFLLAQNTPIYSIQVGVFVNPKIEDFKTIHSLGYLYGKPFGDNFTKVYLGKFKTRQEAESILLKIKNKGYRANISERPLSTDKEVLVVQFNMYQAGKQIDWTKYESIGKLYTVLERADLVKIVTGPFNDLKTARIRANDIKQLGYKDAFVKKVNRQLLEEVGAFEMGRIPVKKDLNAVVEMLFEEPILKNYEVNQTALHTSKNTEMQPSLVHAKVKRTAALDLQKVLKKGAYYKGSLDGYYGKGTKDAFNLFENENTSYQKYALLSTHFTPKGATPTPNLQLFIDKLPTAPISVTSKLRQSNEPLAKAYLAYWIWVNNGNRAEVNQLMNAAIKSSFVGKKLTNTPPFDYKATYAYENLDQIILHLRYLHMAPSNNLALPCWLFERHPKETAAAFDKVAFNNISITNCSSFETQQTFKVLNAIITDLQPSSFSKEQAARQEKLVAARTYLYLLPKKVDAKQKKDIDQWLKDFWAKMETNAPNHPVLAKNLTVFQIVFFQAQVLLEDHFLNQNFTADEAEGLALSILKTYVEVPLEVYLK
jgi:hypothetical protein